MQQTVIDKLKLLEYYSDKITSLSGSIYTNLTPLYEKRNAIVSTFDNFENYLFYFFHRRVFQHPHRRSDSQEHPLQARVVVHRCSRHPCQHHDHAAL